jgi:hypothetical protein
VPYFLRLDQTLHLKVREMMPNGDRIDVHCLGKLIDGNSRAAKQRLKDFVFRAFHEKEYNSPLLGCQYIR